MADQNLAGAGKTVMSSIVIDELQRRFRDARVGVTGFYCDWRAPNQTAADVIASLVKHLLQQLFLRQESLPTRITRMYEYHITLSTRPSLGEWLRELRHILALFTRVFIVIDALDELNPADHTRTSLVRAIRSISSEASVMATARTHLLEVQQTLASCHAIEIMAQEEDQRRFLDAHIEDEGAVAVFARKDPAFRTEILNALLRNCQGDFSLSRLRLSALTQEDNRCGIRKALSGLPETMIERYQMTWERIAKQPRQVFERARSVMSWALFAARPLGVEELRHALAIRMGSKRLDPDMLPLLGSLISACLGLVSINPHVDRVRFVHPSARMFFHERHQDLLPSAHSELARTCLTLLSMDVFANGPCPTDQETEARLEQHVLLDYASQHWALHLDHASNDEVQELAAEFVGQRLKLASSIQIRYIKRHEGDRHEGWSQCFPQRVAALLEAASLGPRQLVKRLLDTGADIEETDSWGHNALQLSAKGGHHEVLKMLVEADIDVDGRSSRKKSALEIAARNGHVDMLETLLSAGADVNRQSKGGGTALKAAAQSGGMGIVERLLLARADFNDGSDCDSWRYPRTAISFAAEAGHVEVVKRLLAAGADVNQAPAWGWTLLHRAVDSGRVEVVEVLLDAGARVETVPGRTDAPHTALGLAADGNYSGTMKILERLLEAGASPHATGSTGVSPLEAAARTGSLESFRKLVAAGASPNATNRIGERPLVAAASTGKLRIVKELLAAGVNPDGTDHTEQIPLMAAACNGNFKVVKELLAAGAHVNVRGPELCGAAMFGHVKVVQILLDAGADPNAVDSSEWTALQTAAGNGYVKIVEKLLLGGANVNAPPANRWRQTALQYAAVQNHVHVVERLLAAKAEVDAPPASSLGRTALQGAAEKGHKEVVWRLLVAGANADGAGHWGWTPLQAAAAGGHLEVVELLLLGRATVNAPARGHWGRTALQAAARNGHLVTVKRLLSAGAKVNAAAAAGPHGRIALEVAAENGHVLIVEELLAAGARVDATGPWGWTPLQMAAAGGRLDVVERLLAAGAKVNAAAKGFHGRTALQAAVKGGHITVVERLLLAGADVFAAAARRHGETALEAAAAAGREQILERLRSASKLEGHQ